MRDKNGNEIEKVCGNCKWHIPEDRDKTEGHITYLCYCQHGRYELCETDYEDTCEDWEYWK